MVYQLRRRMGTEEQHASSSSCHFSHPRARLAVGGQDCKYYECEALPLRVTRALAGSCRSFFYVHLVLNIARDKQKLMKNK